MNALSLFSGGCDGLSLAASWVGIDTVAYCDSELSCRAVLRARHPDAPIFESDEDVTLDGLRAAGIDPNRIDLVMGGPPCQIASVAGKRMGASDPRNRWPEFLRVVGVVRPRWVLAENVPGLLSVSNGRLFGDILRDLAQMGYRVSWGCWGAADVGAPHGRERLFIIGQLADTNGVGFGGSSVLLQQSRGTDAISAGERVDVADAGGIGSTTRRANTQAGNQGEPTEFEHGGEVADAESTGLSQRICRARIAPEHAARPERFGSGMEHTSGTGCQEFDATTVADGQGHAARRSDERRRTRPTEPGLDRDAARLPSWLDQAARRLAAQRWPHPRMIDGPSPQYDWEPPRVATGIPDRAARLKMIGNSCPPQQYLVALAVIAEAESIEMEATT